MTGVECMEWRVGCKGMIDCVVCRAKGDDSEVERQLPIVSYLEDRSFQIKNINGICERDRGLMAHVQGADRAL